LKRALHGEEELLRLTPDESHYLGVLRLEKLLNSAARDSLRVGCRQLIHEFCVEGHGRTDYLEELLSLALAFKDIETITMLEKLALRFRQLPEIPLEVRLAVLALLVDAHPPRSVGFWIEILGQDPERFAALVLSGVLAISPAYAIPMLPTLPNNERMGKAAALKLDLAWDNLQTRQRFQFIQDIKAKLAQCGDRFAAPVLAWAETKQSIDIMNVNLPLRKALMAYIGQDSSPRAYTPKLCPCYAD
jgi:hypothetical protein